MSMTPFVKKQTNFNTLIANNFHSRHSSGLSFWSMMEKNKNMQQDKKTLTLTTQVDEMRQSIYSSPLSRDDRESNKNEPHIFSNIISTFSHNNVKNIQFRDIYDRKTKLLGISKNSCKILNTNEGITSKLTNIRKNSSVVLSKMKFKMKNFIKDNNINLVRADTQEEIKNSLTPKDKKIITNKHKGLTNTESLFKNKYFQTDIDISDPDDSFNLNCENSIVQSVDHRKSEARIYLDEDIHFFMRNLKNSDDKSLRFRRMSLLNKNEIEKEKKHIDDKNIISKKKEQIKILNKLDLNDKLYQYINKDIENYKTPKSIHNFQFKKITESYERNLMPYLRHVTFNNITKFDYITRIDCGNAVKDVIAKTVMNRQLPGTLLNKGSKGFEIVQPRYIKNSFKKKTGFFENLNPAIVRNRIALNTKYGGVLL